MKKTVEYEGKKIVFTCEIPNHIGKDCGYEADCKMEALHYRLQDYEKDCFLCPYICEKVKITSEVKK